MGLLTQIVGAVVTIVEEATGNEDSDAGNWTEQQAANIENAAEDASEAAAEAASDTVDFIKVVTGRMGANAGDTLFRILPSAGFQMPSDSDLASIVPMFDGVMRLTAARIEERATQLVGSKAVGAAKQGAGRFINEGVASFWSVVFGIEFAVGIVTGCSRICHLIVTCTKGAVAA